MAERRWEEDRAAGRAASGQRYLEAIQARCQGLSMVFLIFVLSRLAFYIAAFFGTALIRASVPSRESTA